MTKHQRTIKRYSTCFKLQVVEEIEKNGLSIEECRLKYDISGANTIQTWLLKFGKQHLLNKIIRVETRVKIYNQNTFMNINLLAKIKSTNFELIESIIKKTAKGFIFFYTFTLLI